MASAEYDLGYLQGGIPQLENYLLSKELYWPAGGTPPPGELPFPKLTPGGILLAQARLHARILDSDQRAELGRLDEELDVMRNRWRVAWEAKVGRDFSARLRLWRDYLEDYRENPSANKDRYNYEVRHRVMLSLLSQEGAELPPAEVSMVSGLDQLLRAVFYPGDFIWDAELQDGFPREQYWYLFGQVRDR
jgi:hypothetical protein